MWMSLLLLATLQTGAPRVHTWIADLKASRATLTGREVQLEGDVVDIRTTSPSSHRGLYRIIDASDRAGVLVRSDQLPLDGGSFRIRARIAADTGSEGTLLVDELERDRADARPLAPVMATGLSGVLFVLVAVLLGQVMRDERRHLVAPPLWLLPEAGPYGKLGGNGGAQPATLKYQPELEEADNRKRDHLRRRKRSLVVALIGSLVVTGTSAAWVLDTRTTAPQVPAFILVDAEDGLPVRPPAPADSALRDQPPTVQLDSGLVHRAPGPAVRQDSTPARRPTGLAAAPSGPQARTAPPVAPAPDQTVAPSPAPAPAPPPAPVPAPAPAPSPPPEPARVNPEEERARADAILANGASSLVAAINARAAAQVAGLVPETMADNPDRRDKFMKFIREFGPKATLGTFSERTFAEDRMEAKFTVSLVWRGDFGVDRRKSGRLLAVARRSEAGWRFEGARLLEAIP